MDCTIKAKPNLTGLGVSPYSSKRIQLTTEARVADILCLVHPDTDLYLHFIPRRTSFPRPLSEFTRSFGRKCDTRDIGYHSLLHRHAIYLPKRPVHLSFVMPFLPSFHNVADLRRPLWE